MSFEDIFTGVTAIDNVIAWAISCRGTMAAIKRSDDAMALFEELNNWIPEDVDYYTVLDACNRLMEYKDIL